MTKNTLFFALIAVGLVTMACQQKTSDSVDQPTEEIAEKVSAEEDAEAVQYEPAYPTDVSSEGLTQDDVAQQETLHSHDDEGHSDDDGGHSHEDGDSNKHSHEGEGDHDDHEH